MPKNHRFWFVLFSIIVFISSKEAFAATDLHDPSGTYVNLLSLVLGKASHWDARLKGYAIHLFWSLAIIQFVWTFFPLVFRQSDFGEIIGELFRFVMVIGFFYALLLFSTEWAGAVVNSFREAGASAANLGTKTLLPGDVFAIAVDIANTIGNVHTMNPITAFMISLSSVIALLSFAFIAAFMGMTLIESYVVINASTLFMGFGGSQWTREYAVAIARYAVAVGAKLFVLTLIVGLITDSAKEWAAAYDSDSSSMWTMVGLSLTCAYLAKSIPELIAGMISGTSMGGGTSLGGIAAAVAAGVATGGAAAFAGIGSAAAGSGAAAAAGSGASGVASSLGSSAATGSSTAGAATANSAGLGASTGGSSAANSAGAKVGGSGSTSASSTATKDATKPATSSDAKDGGKQAPNSEQKKSEGPNKPAEKGQSETKEAGANAKPQNKDPSNGPSLKPSKSGLSGHQVASGLTKTVGTLSSIAVPGMEGAAGLSLGAPPSLPEPEGNNSLEVNAVEPEKTAEPQNIIKPAEPEAKPNADSNSKEQGS